MKKICLLFFVLLSASLTSAQSSIIPVSEMVKLYKARNFQSASTTLERYGFKYQGYEPLRGGDSRRTFSKNCTLEDAALSITRMGANNSGIIVCCDYDNYNDVMSNIFEEVYNQTNINTLQKQITTLGYKKGYSASNGQFYVKDSNSPVLLLVDGDRFGYKFKKLSIWSYAGYDAKYGEKKSVNANAVDLGLSVLWADRNMGASDIADYGKLYSCPFSYWATGDAEYSGNKDDKAKNEWGGNWRIPSKAEIRELCEKCRKTIVTLSNGVVGLKFVGPNGNSIVLPLSGEEDDKRTTKAGDGGYYWTSSFRNYMQILSITANGNVNSNDFSPRTTYLMSIRPVMNKDKNSASSSTGQATTQTQNKQTTVKDELLENAQKGDKNSQYALGLNLLTGTSGYKKNMEQGFSWMLKAAQQNLAKAQAVIGECYHDGYGTQVDYNKAVFWYTKAAKGGDYRAQCNLGKCYLNGEGVAKNKNTAIYWYKQAAKNGSDAAKQNLRDLGVYSY